MRVRLEKVDVPFSLHTIDLLGADDEGLRAFSREGGLALSVEEMRRIQDYFRSQGRNPTDVEMQSLGQAWSEHCCYKSSRFYLREQGLGFLKENPWRTRGKVLLKGDAGVMEFDKDNAYALRIESHNHPSAVEPYGGAATGIGGIVRDVLCMGAKPIALIDPLHFGPLDVPMEGVPKGAKHPKYLFGGVVAGIRDYGNRIGVPTVSGCVVFDEGYLGNIVVNVGCIGIAPKGQILRNAVGGTGDVLLLCGGRTGRDGIHGVTFASLELDEAAVEEWQTGAVQLGDPIMEEPLVHACLEAASRGLLNGMKDLGGGGLSCVVGEMALASGCGAEVHLDRVPLKEEGLAPWEIWVSESQERMMLSVPPEKLPQVLLIFQLYDVPATPIGTALQEPVARVFYRGVKVFEMELPFLTGGPEYCRAYAELAPERGRDDHPPAEPDDLRDVLLRLLASPNVASKEWIIRQYDHEVKASTVLKPMQGRLGKASHGDAAVLKPLFQSWRGLAVATASCPRFAQLDPYRGGMAVVEEVCRNLAAVGARPDAVSDCLNYGNPEKPERMGAFRETLRGMAAAAQAFAVSIPSGNVSFYNEGPKGAIPPTPVALGVGIVEDIRRVVSTDLKASGNIVYLVGETRADLGGSEYYRILGGQGGTVPDVDLIHTPPAMEKLVQAIDGGLVRACHDLSHGGLAVAVVEMALGGDVGCRLDLGTIGGLPTWVKLFSESNGRWLVEVEPGKAQSSEEYFRSLPFRRLGEVGGGVVAFADGPNALEVDVGEARKAWSSGLTAQVVG